jgi:hypothetical protein
MKIKVFNECAYMICRCGHSKSGHFNLEYDCSNVEYVEYSFDIKARKRCKCQTFIQDNLSTIEALAKERKLI